MAKPLFSLDRQIPQIMAIVNTTPDSFSDGGSYYQAQSLDMDLCRRRIDQAIAEGASIIDIGGESTRPGAQAISLAEEMDRVLPAAEYLSDANVVVSVDTSSPELMREAAKLGAGLINDIRALTRPHTLETAADLDLPVCLMHMQGEPGTMQNNPQYNDVCADVVRFFQQRIAAFEQAGIKKEHILLDPSFGFGKNLMHNQQLMQNLQQLAVDGLALLVGVSRKRMLGEILSGRDVSDRVTASAAMAMLAVQKGAWIVRVHDVKETSDALKVLQFAG